MKYDPDTLRAVISWHDAQAAACVSRYHREKKRNGTSNADVAVETHEQAIAAFQAMLEHIEEGGEP